MSEHIGSFLNLLSKIVYKFLCENRFPLIVPLILFQLNHLFVLPHSLPYKTPFLNQEALSTLCPYTIPSDLFLFLLFHALSTIHSSHLADFIMHLLNLLL